MSDQSGATRSSARHIVVGVDGSEGSMSAVEWAVREAQGTGASVEVVSAWTYPATMAYSTLPPGDFSEWAVDSAKRAVARAAEVDAGVPVKAAVYESPAALALVRASEAADLLVVGSRGLGGFRGLLLGSVSQHCAHHARCPVVIVRPRQAEEPGS